MTPIMQKIVDLKSAITRYNRVSANAKSKIVFALGIITFADEAIEELVVYFDNIKHNICHDALPLTMIREWLENTIWIDKHERLYMELHDYAAKPLSHYGLRLDLDGVKYTDTLHMFKAIEERFKRIMGLISEIEAILKAPNPELYEYFYHHLRAHYNEKEAIDFMDDWLSHSGIPTLEKYKTFRAEQVIRFIKGTTLDCAGVPSVEEREKVDVERFKRQVPLSYQEEEWFVKCFDERFVIFSRTVRWEGDFLVPNYDCAGLFIFQHWNSLSEEDIKAIFYLDKMLELIQAKMKPLCGKSDVTVLPAILATPEAMRLWKKAQRAGYVDEHFQPLLSKKLSAVLAAAMARRLDIRDRWKPFELLWNRKNLYNDFYAAQQLKGYSDFDKKLRELFA